MAIESDVLVVGGGLAGCCAALGARREGVDVRLLSASQSTLRNASGLIDMLGYTDDSEEPVRNPFTAMEALSPEHPYQLLSTSAIRDGFALFEDRVPEYAGSHTDRNALVMTHAGTVKPTARYPRSMQNGLVSDPTDVLLVGFDSLVDFDAPLAAGALAQYDLPFSVRGVTLAFPGDIRADATETRYATMLEDNELVEQAGGSGPVRAVLADTISPHLDGEQRVGFPPILGVESTAMVRSALEDHLGAAVFEIPTSPPSLPGKRLESSLFDALSEVGVWVETGNPVVDYTGDRRIESVLVDREGTEVPYEADTVVLATGGLVGAGITSDRTAVTEPVFDCHVAQPADRYDWYEDDVYGSHPFARFGVDIDDSLQPLAADGCVEFENLWAAGAVIGGYDFAAENSGSGVSIATGVTAGRRAAGATQ